MESEELLRSRHSRGDFNWWFHELTKTHFPVLVPTLHYLNNGGYTWASDIVFHNHLWDLLWADESWMNLPFALSELPIEGLAAVNFDADGFRFIFASPQVFLRYKISSDLERPPFVRLERLIPELRECGEWKAQAEERELGLFIDRTTDDGTATSHTSMDWVAWDFVRGTSYASQPNQDVTVQIQNLDQLLNSNLKPTAPAQGYFDVSGRISITEWLNLRSEQWSALDEVRRRPSMKLLKKGMYVDPARGIPERRINLASLNQQFYVWHEPRLRSGGTEYTYADILKASQSFSTQAEAESHFQLMPQTMELPTIHLSVPINHLAEFQSWLQSFIGVEFPLSLPTDLSMKQDGQLTTWLNTESRLRRVTRRGAQSYNVQTPLFPCASLFECVGSKDYLHFLIKYGDFAVGYRAMGFAAPDGTTFSETVARHFHDLSTLISDLYAEGRSLSILFDVQKIHCAIVDEQKKLFIYGSSELHVKHLKDVMVSVMGLERRVRKQSAYGLKVSVPLPYESWIRHVDQLIGDTRITDWVTI